jgi:hypothetical protein
VTWLGVEHKGLVVELEKGYWNLNLCMCKDQALETALKGDLGKREEWQRILARRMEP